VSSWLAKRWNAIENVGEVKSFEQRVVVSCAATICDRRTFRRQQAATVSVSWPTIITMRMLSTAALVSRTILHNPQTQKNAPSLLIVRHFAKAAASKSSKAKPSKVVTKPQQQPKKPSLTDAGSRPSELQLILAALDAPTQQEPAISQEERDRRSQIGRNYVIGKFRQHNELHHDLACKLQMKQHAINMLPKHSKLREEALKIDESGPPSWRKHAVWTPPIPGFDPNQLDMTRDEK
jgi:hypothetical protein